MRELAVPFVLQATPTSCGAAALLAVLRYYGHRVSEATIRKRARTTAEGTTLDGVIGAARTWGVEPWPWAGMPYPVLCAAVQAGHPIIALVGAEDAKATLGVEGHFVVITAATVRSIVVMDPAHGARVRFTPRAWAKRWHEPRLGYDRLGLVCPVGTIRRRESPEV